MRIGLIDADGGKFPNIPLMKISAWHKTQGHSVEWYDPMFSGHMDKVYMSKVFSFSPEYEYCIDADEIIEGGSGYAIKLVNGKEVYDKSKDIDLPPEIEHIYPDYSLYGITNKAYGFLTRGCPRGCSFCVVEAKEGRRAYKVADLSEFWNGQKNIVLCDPNILACREWKDLLQQLIDSEAYVDFNQGLDIRLMTDEKIAMLNEVKVKQIHFAWDNPKDNLEGKFADYATKAKHKPNGAYGTVYVLVNFNSTMEENLHRIYTLRELGFDPYVMIYDKTNLPRRHELKRLQRWCNNRWIFKSCERFEDYMR